MNLHSPLITVGITCFNAEKTIGRAVTSALLQNWSNFEVVIVDDCSSDNSWRILNQFDNNGERLTFLRHKSNKGYPAALNSILNCARGEFIAIFDDDDDNSPDRLRTQFERIVSYESTSKAKLVLCYSNRNVVLPGQTTPDHIAPAIGRRANEPVGQAVADYILGIGRDRRFAWGMFGSCTLMARTSTFNKIGPFDYEFRRSAEWDFAIRGAMLGAHFIAVDAPLVTQYKTVTSDKTGRVPLKYALRLRRKHRGYLRSKRAYFSSCAIAYSNFYGNSERKWSSRLFRIAAMMLKPSLFWIRLRSRCDSQGG